MGAGIINFRVKRPLFFVFFFVLKIEKKPSRRSLPKKKTPDSDVNRGLKSESGVFFFVGDLLDGFFSICNTKIKTKKGGLLTLKLIVRRVPAPTAAATKKGKSGDKCPRGVPKRLPKPRLGGGTY